MLYLPRALRRARERLLRRLAVGGNHPDIVAALGSIPRELFLPPDSWALAYDDAALPVACGQTISQPSTVALMLRALMPLTGQIVLDIGCGTGYAAACLARLVGPAGRVVAVERHERLLAAARDRLAEIQDPRRDAPVHCVVAAEGILGAPGEGPFTRVHMACAAANFPEDLWAQVSPGGLAVLPVGPEGAQRLLACERAGEPGSWQCRELAEVAFVPMIRSRGEAAS